MRYSIYLFVLLLCSCASQVTSIKKDADNLTLPNTGYVLLGIETKLNLKSILISGPQNIRLSSKDLRRGTNYLLVDLESGEYSIDRINLSHYWRLELDDEYWSFEIKPGQINYIGHIELVPRGFFGGFQRELVNRSSEALEFMAGDFPNILSKRELIYGGPGEDFFFETLANLLGEMK